MFRKFGLVLALFLISIFLVSPVFGIDNQKPQSEVTEINDSSSFPVTVNTLTFPITYIASDNAGGSGVKEVELWYRYRLSPGGPWVGGGNGWTKYNTYSFSGSPATQNFTAPGDGYYEFVTHAKDWANNYETNVSGKEKSAVVETVNDAPNSFNLVAPPSGSWVNTTPALDWEDATDNDGTIATYRIVVSINSDLSSPVIDVTQSASLGSSYNVLSGLTGGNTYYWRVQATDDDGASTWATSKWTFKVDSQKPSSSATCPSTGTSLTFDVNYSASDNAGGSGLKNVKLYYSYSSDGGTTWSSPVQYDSEKTSTSGHWHFTGSDYGMYSFYTIAEDNAGNVEDAPAGPDCTITIATDTVPPVVNSLTAPSSPTTNTNLQINYDVSDTGGSKLEKLQIWFRYRHNEGGTWGSWSQYDGDVTSIDGQDNATGHIHFSASNPGQYQFDCRVQDGAGNWNHGSNQGDFSALASITVNDNASACALISPADDDWINASENPPTLTWEDVNRTFNYKENYRIMVSDHYQDNPYGFDHLVINETRLASLGSSYAVGSGILKDNDAAGGPWVYYWAVLALDDNDTPLPVAPRSLLKGEKCDDYVFHFKIDSKLPVSNVTAPTSPTTVTIFNIAYTASDTGGSKLDILELWYRYRHNQGVGGWSNWTQYDGHVHLPTSNTASGNFPVQFNCPNGYGQYEFDSRVKDKAGNWNHGSNQGDFAMQDNITVNEDAKACVLVSPGNSFSNPNDVWIKTKTPILIWQDLNAAASRGRKANYREQYEILISDGSAGQETNPYSFLNKLVDKLQLASLGHSYNVLAGDGLKDCDQNGNRPYYWAVLAIDDNDTPLPGPGLGLTFRVPPDYSTKLFKFKIDSVVPSSSVTAPLLPNPTTQYIVTIPYSATDSGGSGLTSVELWYRHRSNASDTWTTWAEYGTNVVSGNNVSAAFNFNTYTTGGKGEYQFYTRAHDLAGNYEDAPASADASLLINNPPTFFNLLTPADGIWIKTKTPTLTWEPSSDPDPLTLAADSGRKLRALRNGVPPLAEGSIVGYNVIMSNGSLGPETNPFSFLNQFHLANLVPLPSYDVPGGVLNDYDANGNNPYYWTVFAVDDNNGMTPAGTAGGLDLNRNSKFSLIPISYDIFSFMVDSAVPVSSVNPLGPPTNNPTHPLTFTATDSGGSGLTEVAVWYRYRVNAAYPFGPWTLLGTYAPDAPPITLVRDALSGYGIYEFYSIAKDLAGNVEAPPDIPAPAPEGYDAVIEFVTTSPAPTPTPGGLNLNVRIGSNIANANAAGDIGEGVIIMMNPISGQVVFLGLTNGNKVEVQTLSGQVLGTDTILEEGGLYTITIPLLVMTRDFIYHEGKNNFKIVAYGSEGQSIFLDRTVLMDSTAPILSDLVGIGGQLVLAGDFISSGGNLKIKLTEINEGSGVDPATFKYSILNSEGTAVFESTAGDYLNYDEATGIIEFKLPTSLASGSYDLNIEVGDKVSPANIGHFTVKNLILNSTVEITGGVLPYPNPYNPNNGSLTIAYSLSANADILLCIYSATGKRIFRADYPAGTAGGSSGYNTVSWDGRDASGEIVANGLYLIHVIDKSSGRLIGRGKIAVVRQ